MHTLEGKISKLEDKSIESIQNETQSQGKRGEKQKEQSIWNLWDCIKWSWFSFSDGKEKVNEETFLNIMAKNFPNWQKLPTIRSNTA